MRHRLFVLGICLVAFVLCPIRDAQACHREPRPGFMNHHEWRVNKRAEKPIRGFFARIRFKPSH